VYKRRNECVCVNYCLLCGVCGTKIVRIISSVVMHQSRSEYCLCNDRVVRAVN